MLRLTRRSGALLGLLPGALVSGFLFVEILLPQFEQAIMDQMIRWRGPLEASRDIVICAIDQKSIAELGRWPWDRSRLAEIVTRLQADGAGVIAFDMLFSEPAEGDEELAKAIARAGNVVLGFQLSDASTDVETTQKALDILRRSAIASTGAGWPGLPQRQWLLLNVGPLAEAARRQGFIDSPLSFGVARYSWLVQSFDGRVYPSLPLSAVKQLVGAGAFELSPLGENRHPGIRLAEREIPITPEGLLWINYRGGPKTFEHVSVKEVLAGRVAPGTFAGRIVFVGVTVQGVHDGDAHQTPFPGLTSGVEIHANVADNILQSEYLRDSGKTEVLISWIVLLLLGPLVGFSAASFPDQRVLGASLGLLLLSAWAAACYLAFLWFNTHLQIVAPVLAGGLALLVTLFLQVHDAEQKLAEELTAKATANADKLERLVDKDTERMFGLVLTEVVDSTALAAKHQDPGEIRQAHFAQARTLLGAHGGEELGTLGDLFLAAFPTTATALDYALGLWEETGHRQVKIRGGVHSGQISFRAAEPFGNNLNILTRLAMMPENAEIWISDKVKQEIDDNQILRYLDRHWRQKTTTLRGVSGKRTLWILVPEGPEVVEPVPETAAGFDVFLSYNSKDSADVEELGRALEARGVKVWLDTQQILPGRNWQKELQKAIKIAPAAAVLIGEHGLGQWAEVEAETFLIASTEHGKPIIPVLLPGAPDDLDLPDFLDRYNRVDLRDGLSDEEELDRLAAGITGRRSRPR